MKSTGNVELDAVLQLREAERAQRAKSWVAVRWVPQVTYFPTKEAARKALARMPVARRAGLVHCATGETWVNRKNYGAVMAAVRREGNAPERFRRVGHLGPFNQKRGRARGPYKRRR